MPLKSRLKERGAKAAFAKKMGISDGRLTNWFARGVPPSMLRIVCHHLEISVAKYRAEADLPPESITAPEGTSSAQALVSDFEQLPPTLRDHVAKQTRELRELIETVSERFRPLISAPPKDPERYKEWEDSIRLLAEQSQRAELP